jgi:hypothetical protein
MGSSTHNATGVHWRAVSGWAPSFHHLYWPDLDVDLAVESLDHPERFPLVSRKAPGKRPKRAGRR